MTEGVPAPGGSTDQQLAITVEQSDGWATRLVVAGEVDLATEPQLRMALLAAVGAAAPPQQVVVDLAQLRFIDAVGIRALINARNAALDAGIGFSAQRAYGIVRRVIEILELDEVLNTSFSRT